MRRMSRRVGFIVPTVVLAFFLAGCPKRDATPAMSTTAAPASPEPDFAGACAGSTRGDGAQGVQGA